MRRPRSGGASAGCCTSTIWNASASCDRFLGVKWRLSWGALDAALTHLWRFAELRQEVTELLDVLSERVTHLHTPADISADIPLQVHATYAREEVLAALATSTIDAPIKPMDSLGGYFSSRA